MPCHSLVTDSVYASVAKKFRYNIYTYTYSNYNTAMIDYSSSSEIYAKMYTFMFSPCVQ